MIPLVLAESGDYGQIIFILIAMIVGAFNWLKERRAAQRREEFDDEYDYDDSPNEIDDVYEQYREEIRQRQAQQQAQQEPAVLSRQPAAQPPALTRNKPVSQPPGLPAKAQKPRTLSAAERQALEQIKQRQQQQARKKRPQVAGTSARAQLRSPQSLKQAVILQEILGKPKALQ
ncbi:hypothetical protein [Persicirhabdus sediminis]|uniref:Uncharacterized protein n=1 Tax=Persicirhabdus sediminis TaxID=454144 RepID=A0A8J7MGQ1_9BACT|nr:hypothetical protein [Persicirhabdus sediminis]MBK1792620.1 hypothetical protein [Persicirhabdus sediminis]